MAEASGADRLRAVIDHNAIANVADERLYEILDKEDPLKHLRNEFSLPPARDLYGGQKTTEKVKQIAFAADESLLDDDESCIYMNGNSLGVAPRRASTITQEVIALWMRWGHHGHMHGSYPFAFVDEMAVPSMARIVGALPKEVAIMNGLTVNIHILLATMYRPSGERYKILIEKHAFPSDHYAVQSHLRLRGYNPDDAMIFAEPRKSAELVEHEDIYAILEQHGHEIALVWLPGVHYYTGQLFDMKQITAVAQSKGCLVGYDLAHAAGNVPLQLHEWNVDCAAWCTYKYVNASAGGIAGTYIHERHLPHDGDSGDRQMLQGWWGHRISTRFDMSNEMELSEGIGAYRISNPPAVLFGPLFASLEIFDKTDMNVIRHKSRLMTAYTEQLIEHYLGELSVHRTTKAHCRLITPKEESERGAQLSLTFTNIDIDAVYAQLERRAVSCDVRRPSVIRVAPTPLYTRYKDVFRFVRALVSAINACESE